MSGKGPSDVLAYELGRMVRACTEGFDYRRRSGRVAQPHGEVAQPALIADAADRRALQPLVELAFRPAEELDQARAVQSVAGLEIALGARPGEAVPGADELAVVAAVDAVADERPQLLWNRALVVDGEVRDTAASVELVGSADRLRGAHVDAALARPTSILLSRIDGKRQVAVNLAEEEPRARLAVEKQGVLAAPADSGSCGKLDLEHGRRVGEHAVAERADFGLDALAELLQARTQHLVIVAAAGVARDVRMPRF